MEEGPAAGLLRAILLLGEGRTGRQVVPVALGVVRSGVEAPFGVEALRSVRRIVGAGPLDPAAAAQAVVGDRTVVARAPARARLPGLKGRLGVVPPDQRLPVAVAEVHAAGVVEEDVEVAPRLARRLDRLR